MSGLDIFQTFPPSREPLPSSVIWRGARGRTYDFNIHVIGTAYYDLPGVYIFCDALGGGRWRALYIGETSSFARRLTSELHLHHCWKRIC